MKAHVRVRPHDGEKTIWVVDVYDGRGAWESSSYGPCDMTKREALRKAAEDFELARNPTIEQLAVETKAAQALAYLEIADSMNTAKLMTRIAFDEVREEDECGYPGEKTQVYYVVVSGYRFGPKDIFPKEYTVAIQL